MFFSGEADVSFIKPNFFRTITKFILRHFGRNLKRIGRVSTKSRCSIKLFHCNNFFVWLEERLSSIKYMTTFVFCLFRGLYQGTDKILDIPNNVYGEKTKAVWARSIKYVLLQKGEGLTKKCMETYVT